MQEHSIRPALAVLGTVILLAACGGGGGGGGDGGVAPGPGRTAELPPSATADNNGLVAFLKDLIANRTDSTGEPVALGNAVLPTSDVSEPLPLN